MDYKNTLNKVRALLSLEVKLAQQTLQDGITTVEAEEFAPDYSVGIVTPDGVIPMPVGEYTLQNGDVMVVEVEGVIKEITSASTEETQPESAHPAAEATEPTMAENTPKKVVESVSKETFFAEIEKIKTELMSQIDTLKSENEDLKIQLASQVPATTPIQHNPEANTKAYNFRLAPKGVETLEHKIFNKLFKN